MSIRQSISVDYLLNLSPEVLNSIQMEKLMLADKTLAKLECAKVRYPAHPKQVAQLTGELRRAVSISNFIQWVIVYQTVDEDKRPSRASLEAQWQAGPGSAFAKV
jgi:hypothetical protein